MADISFNRILTLLRKERGITQKQAAESLGVSQALLSHYEKGIRECGLDFLVRAADFYGVSCDYLLGRSADRLGVTLSVEDLNDNSSSSDATYKGSMLPTLNKKLLGNSLALLFGTLDKTGNARLISEVSDYLMCAVYKMFRGIYGGNPKNSDEMYRIKRTTYSGYADARMSKAEAIINAELEDGECVVPHMTTEKLSSEYSVSATSLFNLIQHTEKELEK